ncbi:MAG: TonB-dependent receptor [Gemmatimonadaceae bacterium]
MSTASAQSAITSGIIEGIAVDSSGAVLSGVEVQLADIGSDPQTTRGGRYRFDSVGAGGHVLVARKLGFQPVTVTLQVLANEVTYADLVMKPGMTTLAPVKVTASLGSGSSAPAAFLQRMASGQGTYFTESDIAKIHPKRVSDLMRRVPGLDISPGGQIFSGRGAVTFKTDACAFGIPIFIDNVQVGGGNMGDPESITDRAMQRKPDFLNPASTGRSAIDGVKPSDIAGIEVYKGPATALATVSGTTSSCGTILIWTK